MTTTQQFLTRSNIAFRDLDSVVLDQFGPPS
jgi:hypothetical protein